MELDMEIVATKSILEQVLNDVEILQSTVRKSWAQ